MSIGEAADNREASGRKFFRREWKQLGIAYIKPNSFFLLIMI